MSNEDNGVTPSSHGLSAAASQRREGELPRAVWSGSFRILGVDIQCHTLEDGRRIIDEDGLSTFIDALHDPRVPDDPHPSSELEAFKRWQAGLDQPRGLSAAEGASPERVIPNPVDPTPGERGDP